jgi:hypothetical protein
VDGRDKPGHDEFVSARPSSPVFFRIEAVRCAGVPSIVHAIVHLFRGGIHVDETFVH